jgi:hypothetical protein
MAANEDHLPPPCFTFTNTALDCLPDVPFIPSVEEAQHRYYGLPSQPYFVVHSSHDIWVMPTGIETYIQLKELHRISEHALCNIWEGRSCFAATRQARTDPGIHTKSIIAHKHMLR